MRLVLIRRSVYCADARCADPVKPDAMVLDQAVQDAQVRAPCAPPPCRARLIDLAVPFEAGVLSGRARRLPHHARIHHVLLTPARRVRQARLRSSRNVQSRIGRAEMPKGYYADARQLSRLRRHRYLTVAPAGPTSVKGTLRECRRSIPLQGGRSSSRARRRLARVPPSSGSSGCPSLR